MYNKKVCAFTGHRTNKLPVDIAPLRQELLNIIEDLIVNRDVCHFVSGMALGIDTIAADCVLSLRDKYPQISLEAAIPCRDQSNKWSRSQREHYNSILSQANKTTVLQENYTIDCMMKRNKYMVDLCNTLVAVWDKTTGGTANTVKYALRMQKQGKSIDIICLDPNTLAIDTYYPVISLF